MKFTFTLHSTLLTCSYILISLIIIGKFDCSSSLATPILALRAHRPVLRCTGDQVLCDDHKECVLKSYVCDGDKDCKDGSDEAHCEEKCSRVDMFTCKDGQCIPLKLRCDHRLDCIDGSDEIDCISKNKEVAPYEVPVPEFNLSKLSPATPVDESVYCDDRQQSDLRCSRCPENSFYCGGNICIPGTWRCDKTVDCPTGSDEKNCPVANCTNYQFSCDGKCIHVDSVCDGIGDCRDRTDEKKCTKTKCSYNQFDCGETCISIARRCDSKKDCVNGSDESNCTLNMYKSYRNGASLKCVEGTFPCADKSGCVSIDFMCDGYANCKDGSDELKCP